MPFSAPPVFSDLTAEVQAWLDRDDAATVAAIPDFIRYAHDEVVRELRLPLTRKTVQGSVDAERVTTPPDLQAVVALSIEDTLGVPLRVTSETMRTAHAALWPAGRPLEYVLEAATLAFAPVPDTAYEFELTYDAVPLLMVADTDTNPIYAATPFLYLQGALAAGFLFNQFPQQAALYESQFRTTLASIRRQAVADAFAGGPMVMRSAPGFHP